MASQDLMEAFNFTVADLEANRSGTLTPAQALRHRPIASKTILIYIAALLIVGILAVGLVYVGLKNDDMTALIFAMFISMFVVMGLRFWVLKLLFGSPNQPVTHLKGTVRLEHSSTPRQSGNTFEMQDTYTLHINKLHFPLSEAQFTALADGKTYTIYYITGLDDILVSIEET